MRITRWLLAPIALTCLLAGLLPLGIACMAASRGLVQGLSDPALAPALHLAVTLAAAAAAPSVILGLAGAACVARMTPARMAVSAIAIVLLVLPAPALTALPGLDEHSLPDAIRLACAIARGAALVLLLTGHAIAAIPPGLRQAALSAGATPIQAWGDVVLAPVWLPTLAGAAAAFLAALAQTRAATILAPHLDLVDAWMAPASLLLVACSVAALLRLTKPG